MREPTPQQKAVLERMDARVRIVRAAPGSGKTWLVAEVIREALYDWPTPVSYTHLDVYKRQHITVGQRKKQADRRWVSEYNGFEYVPKAH